MSRPSHLPIFSNPPLDEVVLGIQFSPPPSYTSANAKDVWEIYRDEFPNIEEHHALERKFETFGGALPSPNFGIRMGSPPIRGRLWFVEALQNSLIQFQEDRFLTNWRKRPNGQEYPRFENIASSFREKIFRLERCFESTFSCKLDINQTEVSYFNILPVEDYSEIGKWIKLWGCPQLKVESVSLTYSEIILDSANKPYARLFLELQSIPLSGGNEKALRLGLTFRGKPENTSCEASMKFVNAGRNHIVSRFEEITTDEAHEIWGKSYE